MGSVSFHHFVHELGDAGARECFEQFVVDTVKAIYPSARPVRANPGDWGIDAYVGRLDEGRIAVWQAKFFLDELAESQQGQIRDAYATAKRKAVDEGYELDSWTLCIPQDMDPKASQWWDRWSSQTRNADDVAIERWGVAEFRQLMAKPDTADVRHEYFPHLRPVHESKAPAVQQVPDSREMEEMLFVHQLRQGGIMEVESAKEQFYNAELVELDLANKGLAEKQKALAGLRADLRSIWEDRFNHHRNAEPQGNRLPNLHPDVMDRVDQAHNAAPREPFPLLRIHRKGALHQVVDRGDAGWVQNYRDVVARYRDK